MPENFVDPESLKQLQRNLLKVKDWTNEAIIDGLEMGANVVVEHAQADHPRPPNKEVAREHPYPRFYTWRGITAAAIHAGKPRANKRTGAEIDVLSPELHSAILELGGVKSNARPFPFMGPALEASQDKVFDIIAAAIRKALKS